MATAGLTFLTAWRALFGVRSADAKCGMFGRAGSGSSSHRFAVYEIVVPGTRLRHAAPVLK